MWFAKMHGCPVTSCRSNDAIDGHLDVGRQLHVLAKRLDRLLQPQLDLLQHLGLIVPGDAMVGGGWVDGDGGGGGGGGSV